MEFKGYFGTDIYLTCTGNNMGNYLMGCVDYHTFLLPLKEFVVMISRPHFHTTITHISGYKTGVSCM